MTLRDSHIFSAYGEAFCLLYNNPALEDRLSRFFHPGSFSSLDHVLTIEFVEDKFSNTVVNYQDFYYEIQDTGFFMNCRTQNCVEILNDRRRALVRYDPRWLSTSPFVADSFLIEAPMLVLLSWYSMPYIHGAALSYQNQGFILIGEQNSGKSTLSYACSLLGFSFSAEDYVFVKSIENNLILQGQPNSLKLCEDTIPYFPHIAGCPRVLQPDGEVKIDVISEVKREQRQSTAPLKGVFLLSRNQLTMNTQISPDALYTLILKDLIFDPAGLERRHEYIYRQISDLLIGEIPMKDTPEKRAQLLLEMISH
jgi:hypothetical protein